MEYAIRYARPSVLNSVVSRWKVFNRHHLSCAMGMGRYILCNNHLIPRLTSTKINDLRLVNIRKLFSGLVTKIDSEHIVDVCCHIVRRGFIPKYSLCAYTSKYCNLDDYPDKDAYISSVFELAMNHRYIKTLKQQCLNIIIDKDIKVPAYYPKPLLNSNSNEREFCILNKKRSRMF